MTKDNERIDAIWTLLVESSLFTDEELKLVTTINGYNEDSLNDCIYARYGVHDIEQLFSDDKQMLKDYGIEVESDEDEEDEEDEDGEESPESEGR